MCGECTSGSFSASGASVCTLCSAGSYQASSLATACVLCESGKSQELTGRPACDTCFMGSFASSNLGATTCLSCPVGKFQDQNLQTSCKDCVAGKYEGRTGRYNDCVACSSGTYTAVGAQSVCSNCETGKVQPAQQASGCVNCQAGQFQSATGRSLCDACLPGSSMAFAGQSACLLCVAGTYQSASQQATCLECGYGRYSSAEGQTACVLCETGKYSQFFTGDQCAPCVEGSYQSARGGIVCDACLPGSYQLAQGASVCLLCAAGTFASGTGRTRVCDGCATGTFQAGLGGSACQACTLCASGRVWGSGCNGLADGVCQDCLPGTYASTTGLYACETCGAGTFQNGLSGTRCDACQACGPGRFASTSCVPTADRTCGSCLAGTFSSGVNLPMCEGCGTGKYQLAGSATACLQCQACAAGFSWGNSCVPTQDATCSPCPAGTFNPSSATSVCSHCSAGTYQSGTGGTACLACQGCTQARYLASGCNGVEDGRCETCTGCPGETIKACRERSDAICRADSSVPRWLMTTYSSQTSLAYGMPTQLGTLTMVGRTYVRFVDFASAADFAAAVFGTPADAFVSTHLLQLSVLGAGSYLLCLSSDDGAFLLLDGERILNTLNSQNCINLPLSAGTHEVYVQHYEHKEGESLTVMYKGPDTGEDLILMPKQTGTLVCTVRPRSRAYAWVGEDERCRNGQYLVAYDPWNGTRACRACPDGWAGLNGIFCERCGPLEEPYFLDRGACVCKQPAVMNASGACVCPDGFQQSGGACVACETSAYGTGGACWACGAGTFTDAPAQTACRGCDFGKYRVAGNQAACSECAVPGWFAPDAAKSECVPCNETCALGWRWSRACPGKGQLSVCEECEGGLPGNASWSNRSECAYDCLPGFFRGVDSCLPCTTNRTCPAGRRLTECTELADTHCDEPCEDASKPEFYSHWETGDDCPWACDAGFELRTWDYAIFQLRECARVGPG